VAVQLPALHWFYLYIPWFLPLLLVAVLATDARAMSAPEACADRGDELQTGDSPSVLVGAR
jgi:hypothetical protein